MRSLFVVCASIVLTTSLSVQQPLPQGPGRDVLMTRCVTCHETDLIAQQRLSRAGWGRELDKMIRWGAVVVAAEREPMLDYLSAHFAPKPVPAQGIAAGAEDIYKRACFVCHDEDLISAQRLSRTGWTREVDKMVRWGAAVLDPDKDKLIDYLASRFPVRETPRDFGAVPHF